MDKFCCVAELLANMKRSGRVVKYTEDAPVLRPALDAPHVSVLGVLSAGFPIAAARHAWISQ